MNKKLAGTKWVTGLLALFCITAPRMILAAAEESFGLLNIGTRTYTNVTVTTKTKTQIFIMHSTGMHTIKVADLPPALLAKLGYGSEPEKKTSKGLASLGAVRVGRALNSPEFALLRGDPRVKTLRKRVGLPE